MDRCQVRLSTMGQPSPECISDTKSRFWQIGNLSVHRAEVICPQPRHATRVPCFVDSLNRFSPKPKGIFPTQRGDCGLKILDIILSKDEPEGDSDMGNQMGFFCGSPPVRTNNPVVNDAQFAKQTQTLIAYSPGITKPSTRMERGSPYCGNPKVRIEGFSCGNSDPRCVVAALA